MCLWGNDINPFLLPCELAYILNSSQPLGSSHTYIHVLSLSTFLCPISWDLKPFTWDISYERQTFLCCLFLVHPCCPWSSSNVADEWYIFLPFWEADNIGTFPWKGNSILSYLEFIQVILHRLFEFQYRVTQTSITLTTSLVERNRHIEDLLTSTSLRSVFTGQYVTGKSIIVSLTELGSMSTCEIAHLALNHKLLLWILISVF